MPDLTAPPIEGAEQLVEWFGRWPSFHDAEVLELSLHRQGKSWLRVHTWRMTREVDPTGHFVLDRHAVVTFWFEDVLDLELADFSVQNVIFGLTCEPLEKGFRVSLSPCFGIAGHIDAEHLAVSLEPRISS